LLVLISHKRTQNRGAPVDPLSLPVAEAWAKAWDRAIAAPPFPAQGRGAQIKGVAAVHGNLDFLKYGFVI